MPIATPDSPLKLPAAIDAMLRPASYGCGNPAMAIAEATPAEARLSTLRMLSSIEPKRWSV